MNIIINLGLMLMFIGMSIAFKFVDAKFKLEY